MARCFYALAIPSAKIDYAAFEPDVTIALPQASIAVMGAEAAVNAVYFNKIQALHEEERPAFVEKLRAEYREDVDLKKLAASLVIDDGECTILFDAPWS